MRNLHEQTDQTMKLNSITVSNFLGLPHLQHKVTSPIVLVAGDNGAGKSSLQQSIRFALTGVMPRSVSKVSDRVKLITEGAQAGYVQLDTDSGPIKRTIKDAKLTGQVPDLPHLDLCLDAAQFARLDDIARRKLLFAITGTQVNAEVVTEQLHARDIPQSVIDVLIPRLKAGFPTAAEFAKDQAAQSRGAWRTIAGEAYGSVKAETWVDTPDVALPAGEEIVAQAAKLTDLSGRVAGLNRTVARLEAMLPKEEAERLQALAANREHAERALDLAQSRYEAATKKTVDIAALVPNGDVPTSSPCPHCGEALRIERGAILAGDAAPEDATDHRPALAQAKVEAHDAHTAVQDCRRALAESEAAAKTLANLPPPPTDDELQAAEILPEVLQLQQQAESDLAALRRARDAHKAAEERTTEAKAHHTAAAAWKAAEEALAPEGIPSVLLARALDPVNTLLAELALEAAWRQPAVTTAIELTYGGRPYQFLSESEQWRADALFAAAISVITGTGLLLLDRLDVLAPQHREDAFNWFDFLVDGGRIETVVVAATLKKKPELEGIDVIWLDSK